MIAFVIRKNKECGPEIIHSGMVVVKRALMQTQNHYLLLAISSFKILHPILRRFDSLKTSTLLKMSLVPQIV